MNLNADIGEGASDDEAILHCVDSANVCCGVHAGSPSLTIATARRCRTLGIEVGAHPGYDDRAGFGRIERSMSAEDVEALIGFQVASLAAVAAIAYVKPHGALYHRCQRDAAAADALVRVAKLHGVGVMGQPGFGIIAAAEQAVSLARSGRYDTICVHGDTPGAAAIAGAVRAALDEAGIETAPLAP